MASVEITAADKAAALRLLEFVKGESISWTVEARFVFVVEANRWFNPDIQEIRRWENLSKRNIT